MLPKQSHFLSKVPIKHKLKWSFISHSEKATINLHSPIQDTNHSYNHQFLNDESQKAPGFGEKFIFPKCVSTFHCPQSTDRCLNRKLSHCAERTFFLSIALTAVLHQKNSHLVKLRISTPCIFLMSPKILTANQNPNKIQVMQSHFCEMGRGRGKQYIISTPMA